MSKCKITGKVLAIQLGREDTQIVLMGKGAAILHSISVQTPAGAVEDGMIRNADAVRNMLKTAIKGEPAFKRVNQAVFTLCTSQVISETVTTPNLPDAKLEKLLQANVDMYFPVDMHDYQLVWQRIGPVVKDNGLKELAVQLWAIPTAMLARYYSVGNACGLSVLAVDYCGHSIATAVGASFSGKAKEQKKSGLNMEISFGRKKTGEAEAEESAVATEVRSNPDTELYLSMEKDLIGMTFVQDSKVVFQRFIRCGADPSYQLGELAMMVDYFSSMDVGRGSTVTAIPCGALCNNRNLMGEVEDALGMLMSPYAADHDAKFVLAVGAVRTTLDFGIPALNKPGKVRKELQTQLWQYLLILAGGLALVAVIMLLLSSRIVWKSGIGSLKTTQQTLTIQAQKTAGFADNYKSYAAKYDSYSADWDTIFSSLRTYNDNLVLVLEELEDTLPENTSVTGLQIAADGLNVQFACETKEEAAYLIMALREMKYADLVGITDLQGGGVGPATSYGSGETEAPPTEGGPARSNAVTNLVSSELSKEELAALAGSLTGPEIKAMEKAYAAQPTNTLSLAEVKAANTLPEEEFFAKRQNAMKLLLTKQPFAAHRFIQDLLIDQDWNRYDDGILLPLISEELFDLDEFTPEAVVGIITRDEETLSAAEELICTDESITNVEGWYVYYLETQNGDGYPYLDMGKLANDLMDNGHFNTESDTLNTKLDALISDETRELLMKLNSEEEIGKMVNDYFTKGSSDNVTVDALINDYLATGSTGVPAVDDKIEAYLQSGAMDGVIGTMVDKYLATGTTENTIVDSMINDYLTTGSTGNGEFDVIIDDYLASGAMDAKLADMLNKYLTTGTTESPVADKLINDYLTTGTTGNPKLDAVIESQLDNPAVKDQLQNMAKQYALGMLFGNPTTGNKTLDAMIERYLSEEKTTGNPKIDAMLGSVLGGGDTGPTEPGPTDPGPTDPEPSEPTAPDIPGQNFDLTDEQIEEIFDAYLKDGTVGNDEHNLIVENYLNHGNTGDLRVNTKLNELLVTDEVKAKIEELVSAYFKDGTSGNTTVDGVVTNYLLNGIGRYDNVKLGNLLTEQIRAENYNDEIEGRLNGYILSETPKTTGHETLDTLIKRYNKDNTTGNAGIDKIFKGYNLSDSSEGGDDEEDNPFGDYSELFTQENINKLVLLYNMNGTTNIAKVDEQFNKYVKTGKTDYPLLDPMLKEAGLKVKGSSSIDDALSSLLGNNSGGSSGGASSGPKDTRVFFNAVLGYNDELKNAELIRKGLYYGDKIDKVEVED